jgi:hypothetical protein
MADKNAARNRAETAFSASSVRDAAVKEEIAKERVAFDVRTQKLRALRLAREEEERAEKAAKDAANPPKPAKAAKPKPRKAASQ